jgi:hypothetical protein
LVRLGTQSRRPTSNAITTTSTTMIAIVIRTSLRFASHRALNGR